MDVMFLSGTRSYEDAAWLHVVPIGVQAVVVSRRSRARCSASRSRARRRRHGAGHREGSDGRRDAGRRGQDQQSGRPASTGRRRRTRSGKFVFRNLAAESAITSPLAAQGFQTLERDVDVRTRCRSMLDLTLALAARRRAVEVVGHAEDLLERDPTAHTDIDQSLIATAADRVVVRRPEPGHHAGVARRRGRREWLLPSDRRSRADTVLDRQPAGHRSAEPHLLEPDLAGGRAVDGGDHRRRAGRIRRQGQSGRAHHHEVGSRPAEADGQRSAGYGSFKSPTARSTSARARTRSATSCLVHGLSGRIAFSIRRSSRRCTTTAQRSRSSIALDAHPSDADTLHLNVQVGAVVV